MDAVDGVRLYFKAKEEIFDEMIFKRWLPYQTQISFDDFKASLIVNPDEDDFDTETVLKDLKDKMDRVSA